MQAFYPEPFVYIHPSSAKKKGHAGNDLVSFHGTGEVELRQSHHQRAGRFSVMYEAWFPKTAVQRKTSWPIRLLIWVDENWRAGGYPQSVC